MRCKAESTVQYGVLTVVLYDTAARAVCLIQLIENSIYFKTVCVTWYVPRMYFRIHRPKARSIAETAHVDTVGPLR